MIVFPAIDIKDNCVVRLSQGDYDRVVIYDENATRIAADFKNQGASHLHIVDLDGAKSGRIENSGTVRRILSVKGLFCEIGGGIRDEKCICDYFNMGVSRVILGTAAINNFEFTKAMALKYGDRIAVGVDARDSLVAVDGWTNKTNVNSVEFCQRLLDAGVKTVIYTDISRDGMLAGCNLEIYERLCEIKGLDVVASGGVSSDDEIKRLKSAGCAGVIVGKAIYEGRVNLKNLIALAEGNK